MTDEALPVDGEGLLPARDAALALDWLAERAEDSVSLGMSRDGLGG